MGSTEFFSQPHKDGLVLSGNNLPELEKVYDEILMHGSPKPAIYLIDFNAAAERDYDKLALTIEREFGVIHGLLHGAAAFGPLGPVSNIRVRDWVAGLKCQPECALHVNPGLIGLAAKIRGWDHRIHIGFIGTQKGGLLGRLQGFQNSPGRFFRNIGG